MKFYIFTYNASTNTILTVWYKTVNRYILWGTIARDLKPRTKYLEQGTEI